ncbi:MAG TPA: Asp-tRNA(Asn)/Glu-tRNA(Gln) amidotransferase subunit GatC [Candidatus Paceibacterota bacterium]|nr:Asp-tRNA(Asn)/Glu-tRNA(Gln) amidotransferase subunit GatC [Candidatus Paceibacterota bacterium]
MTSPDDVKKLATLARVEVPDGKLPAFAAEFESILSYIGKLEELQLTHDAPAAGQVRNVLREDTDAHAPGAFTEKLIEQFPERKGDHLVVKQIISYE